MLMLQRSNAPIRPMEPIRRAVIDVGTNSVKLLVAAVAGRALMAEQFTPTEP